MLLLYRLTKPHTLEDLGLFCGVEPTHVSEARPAARSWLRTAVLAVFAGCCEWQRTSSCPLLR